MAVEFAVSIPFLLLVCIGLMEMGRAFEQANAVEKGMRVGAIYGARLSDPSTTANQTLIENLVKTGTIDGSGAYLVEGWSDSAANVNVVTSSYNLGGDNIPVVKITASVPFKPILPDLAGWVGLSNFTITLSHEQAYVDE